MAKKARARVTARKTREAWKAKQWYRVLAPGMFGEAEIGETPAREPEMLLGRVSEASLQDMSGDFTKSHIKLYFKINGIKGTDASTEFIGHNMTSDYVRRLTRRRSSKIDDAVDVLTKDGYKIRIKTVMISIGRINSSHQHAVRMKGRETMTDIAANMTMPELVKSMVSGELSKNVAKECRKIRPLKRVEIRKSEILRKPAVDQREEASKEEQEDAVMNALESIDGIGPAKARLVYDAGYHDLESLNEASLEDLESVEKLGKAAAARIHAGLHPENSEEKSRSEE